MYGYPYVLCSCGYTYIIYTCCLPFAAPLADSKPKDMTREKSIVIAKAAKTPSLSAANARKVLDVRDRRASDMDTVINMEADVGVLEGTPCQVHSGSMLIGGRGAESKGNLHTPNGHTPKTSGCSWVIQGKPERGHPKRHSSQHGGLGSMLIWSGIIASHCDLIRCYQGFTRPLSNSNLRRRSNLLRCTMVVYWFSLQ